MANLSHQQACKTADALSAIDGVELVNKTFFNEFTVRLPKAAAGVVEALAEKGVLGGVPVSRLEPGQPELENLLVVATTELTSNDDIAAFAAALKEVI
jgi:glycine dehydrogenase subunit 1